MDLSFEQISPKRAQIKTIEEADNRGQDTFLSPERGKEILLDKEDDLHG